MAGFDESKNTVLVDLGVVPVTGTEEAASEGGSKMRIYGTINLYGEPEEGKAPVPKLGLTRRGTKKNGEARFAALGRMTETEATAVAEFIQEKALPAFAALRKPPAPKAAKLAVVKTEPVEAPSVKKPRSRKT